MKQEYAKHVSYFIHINLVPQRGEAVLNVNSKYDTSLSIQRRSLTKLSCQLASISAPTIQLDNETVKSQQAARLQCIYIQPSQQHPKSVQLFTAKMVKQIIYCSFGENSYKKQISSTCCFQIWRAVHQKMEKTHSALAQYHCNIIK